MFFKTMEQHENLRIKIREFAQEEVKPIAFMLDLENKFPAEAINKLADMGMMGIPYPKEYGGAGLDIISYAIAVEELSRVDGGTGVILSAHTSLGTYPISAYGTEEQKQKYLIPLAKGEKLANARPGHLFLNGNSKLNISGSYLVADGLKFDGGTMVAGDDVVEFRGTKGDATYSWAHQHVDRELQPGQHQRTRLGLSLRPTQPCRPRLFQQPNSLGRDGCRLASRRRSGLPRNPAAMETLDLRGYDLVLSSSSAWAHGVIPDEDAVHVCYCHNPFRYAWNARERRSPAGTR